MTEVKVPQNLRSGDWDKLFGLSDRLIGKTVTWPGRTEEIKDRQGAVDVMSAFAESVKAPALFDGGATHANNVMRKVEFALEDSQDTPKSNLVILSLY